MTKISTISEKNDELLTKYKEKILNAVRITDIPIIIIMGRIFLHHTFRASDQNIHTIKLEGYDITSLIESFGVASIGKDDIALIQRIEKLPKEKYELSNDYSYIMLRP